jgi:hypothetical protein
MQATGIITIADISGYTAFLSNTEIEHANMVMMNLFSAMLEDKPSALRVMEIEGDAIFCWLPEGDRRFSMRGLFELVEHQFRRFVGVQRWFLEEFRCPERCGCQVCQSLGDLRIKFVAHYGRVGVYRVSDFEKISGLDVIIAHRLLKNSVPDPEYVLVTSELTRALGGVVHGEHWLEGADEYPVIGSLAYRYHPLERKGVPEMVVPRSMAPEA